MTPCTTTACRARAATPFTTSLSSCVLPCSGYPGRLTRGRGASCWARRQAGQVCWQVRSLSTHAGMNAAEVRSAGRTAGVQHVLHPRTVSPAPAVTPHRSRLPKQNRGCCMPQRRLALSCRQGSKPAGLTLQRRPAPRWKLPAAAASAVWASAPRRPPPHEAPPPPGSHGAVPDAAVEPIAPPAAAAVSRACRGATAHDGSALHPILKACSKPGCGLKVLSLRVCAFWVAKWSRQRARCHGRSMHSLGRRRKPSCRFNAREQCKWLPCDVGSSAVSGHLGV